MAMTEQTQAYEYDVLENEGLYDLKEAVGRLNGLGEAGWIVSDVVIIPYKENDAPGHRWKIVPAATPLSDREKWDGSIVIRRRWGDGEKISH